ncbi:MAG: ATP-binding protein [Bacteroidetes bacterium]|nr:MAG: ATP-binding protein [Bacteroidota bacterium]
MDKYIPRSGTSYILQLIKEFPAVGIIGPRQVGKTSLALHLREKLPNESIYLDLELPEDLAKLSNPSLYFETFENQTLIIDEVQLKPDLFPVLRSVIDRNRKPGRFILLGSASPELIRGSSETLAGRIAYYELSPFSFEETSNLTDKNTHWLRGGFPGSLLAASDDASFRWRSNFVRTYLERDLPMLGLSAEPILIRRLWTMIAHTNGNVLNYSTFAKSLGISLPTVKRYIDFLESSYLIRRLQPWLMNIRKRITKSPKIYIRDTGILHNLLNITTFEEILAHPVSGGSWEAYVIQELHARLSEQMEMYFYRTQDGTEADLVLAKGGTPHTLVEIKFSTAPKITRSFRTAIADLGTKNNYIVAPVKSAFPLDDGISVCPFESLEVITREL